MTISATSVRFDEHTMWVALNDGRTLGVPLAWFPRLLRATPAEREQVELGRVGLHWDGLDEDITIAGLLAGRDDARTRRLGGLAAEEPAAHRATGPKDGEYQPTAEELAGIDRGLRAAAEGRFVSDQQVEAALAKFRG